MKLRQEFKTLLKQHEVLYSPTELNIEKFSDACALIVERERAKALNRPPGEKGEWEPMSQWRDGAD